MKGFPLTATAKEDNGRNAAVSTSFVRRCRIESQNAGVLGMIGVVFVSDDVLVGCKYTIYNVMVWTAVVLELFFTVC